MPWCPTQASGRAHCMAARRASLHHRDLAAHPRTGVLDRLTRSWVLRPSRLDTVKNVLCARCRPQCEEVVIRVGEGPAAADRHEARVSNRWKDHGRTSICEGPPGQGCALHQGARQGCRQPRVITLESQRGPTTQSAVIRTCVLHVCLSAASRRHGTPARPIGGVDHPRAYLHDRVSRQHLPYSLDALTDRVARRTSKARGMPFYRLLQQAVDTDPHPLTELTGARPADPHSSRCARHMIESGRCREPAAVGPGRAGGRGSVRADRPLVPDGPSAWRLSALSTPLRMTVRTVCP
ncbi:MAG: hypothetical protein JWO98_1403 [Frankiales bacterium]|nr:hypothetical protein [Frankiales bacterium]